MINGKPLVNVNSSVKWYMWPCVNFKGVISCLVGCL